MKEPYWVQIECDPEGTLTFGMQVDLSRVRRVVIQRNNRKFEAVKVIYEYNAGREELVFPGQSGVSFLTKWVGYQKMEAIDPEAEPGLIFSGRQSLTKGP